MRAPISTTSIVTLVATALLLAGPAATQEITALKERDVELALRVTQMIAAGESDRILPMLEEMHVPLPHLERVLNTIYLQVLQLKLQDPRLVAPAGPTPVAPGGAG